MRGPALLLVFSLAAVGAGAGRALTTTYVPYLLHRIDDAPALIGVVMTVNAVSGLLVPLVTGVWSDRRDGRGLGRRLPFMVAGCVLTVGGLVALASGTGTSYVGLGLAAALAYTGLNTLTTAHRALIAEDFEDAQRPRATALQELAALLGAVVAVTVGGVLIEPAPGLAFVIVAGVVAISAVPTLLLIRRRGLGTRPPPHAAGGSAARLRSALARPGAREVLVAQTLWVFAYAALPAYFVLYATESLGLAIGFAGLLPIGFGAITAIGILLAGRAAAQHVRALLLAGVTLLGIGLLGAGLAPTLSAAAPAFAGAALGAGMVTSLGFPYFARFVPDGQAGSYSGLFFAGRAIAAGAALPVAGLAIELGGTYRATLWLGASALLAIVPLAMAQRRVGRARRASPARLAAPSAALGFMRAAWPRLVSPIAVALGIAALLPVLQPLDTAAFTVVNGLGDGPEVLYQVLDPHTRNYLVIGVAALMAGAVQLRRGRYVAGLAVALLLGVYLSGAALELVKLLVDRARPEEILGSGAQLTHERSWAALASFPSGHMVVTGALAAVAATALPRFRAALVVYVGLVGVTRIMFGAHFPLDVLVGTVVGWQTGLFCVGVVASGGLLPSAILHRRTIVRTPPCAPHEQSA